MCIGQYCIIRNTLIYMNNLKCLCSFFLAIFSPTCFSVNIPQGTHSLVWFLSQVMSKFVSACAYLVTILFVLLKPQKLWFLWACLKASLNWLQSVYLLLPSQRIPHVVFPYVAGWHGTQHSVGTYLTGTLDACMWGFVFSLSFIRHIAVIQTRSPCQFLS